MENILRYWLQWFDIVQVICTISFWLCVVTFGYNVLLMICGIPRNKKLEQISFGQSRPRNRFAIVIAARNEEKVIPCLIRSLKAMNYPQELFRIFVIADNCTDDTARVAREEGAVVYVRHDCQRATKGYALNWFFSRFLRSYGKDFDQCLIFDADNLVEPDFLSVMDRHIQSGQTVLVGYRDSKNVDESVVAGVNSLFWLNQSRFLHQGRTNLGLSVTSVSGTGFCFALDLIKKNGWSTQSLTEDVEFTMQLILAGERVVFVREARFYDEQTSDMKAMLRQRFRWAVGTVQTMRLMTGPLLKRFLAGDGKILDAFWFLAQIPFFFIAGLLSLLRMLFQLPLYAHNLEWLLLDLATPVLAYVFTVLLMLLLIKLEQKDLRVYRKAILAYPLIGAIWAMQQMGALFCKNAVWHPIEHIHAIEIESIGK